MTERLLDDDAAPAVLLTSLKFGTAQSTQHRGEESRRNGQVEGPVAAGAASLPGPAEAADVASVRSAADIQGRVVNLGLNKSMVLDLPEDVRDVLVSNPEVADAVVEDAPREEAPVGAGVGH